VVEKKLDQTTKQLSETNELVRTLMKQMHFTISLPVNVDVRKGNNSCGGEHTDEDDNEDDDDSDQQENEDAAEDEDEDDV